MEWEASKASKGDIIHSSFNERTSAKKHKTFEKCTTLIFTFKITYSIEFLSKKLN
jgi:hypothetical protein